MRFCEIGSERLGHPDSALILGEGDGRFLKQFLDAYPNCTITVVEQSEGMINAAHKRIAAHSSAEHVRFIKADVRTHRFTESAYDLIVAHCILDCFTAGEIRELIPRLHEAARENALLWIGDFVEPRRLGWSWLRLRALYAFFRVVTRLKVRRVVALESLETKLPIRLTHRRLFHGNALSSSLYRMLPTNSSINTELPPERLEAQRGQAS